MAVLMLGNCVFALALNWYYCCVCFAQGWEIRFFLSTTICCVFHDVFQCCVVLMNIPQWHYVLLFIGLVLLWIPDLYDGTWHCRQTDIPFTILCSLITCCCYYGSVLLFLFSPVFFFSASEMSMSGWIVLFFLNLLLTVFVGPYVEIRCAMWRLLPDSWLWFCPCSSLARVMTCSYVVTVHQQGQWWPIVFSLYERGLAIATLCYLIGSANLCMLYIDICDLSV